MKLVNRNELTYEERILLDEIEKELEQEEFLSLNNIDRNNEDGFNRPMISINPFNRR